jgi:hypothetical protein
MQRRNALKQLGIMVSGAMLLPACVGNTPSSETTIALRSIHLDGDQENFLKAFAECLIPTTDTPGAGALNIHHFVMRMVDDCYDETTQQQFIKGLTDFISGFKRVYETPFLAATTKDQQAYLSSIEAGTITVDRVEDLKAFYFLAKQLTIRGYVGSEYVMTEVYGYTMIPGRFDGIVNIDKNSNLKTILG